MKLVSTVLLILTAAITPAFANGPAWDSSGNSQLSNTYYFRQVLYSTASGGSISSAVTFYGNIVFNGTSPGTYTITNGSAIQSGSAPATYSTSGTYSVSASGFGFMTSPLAAVYGTGANTNVYFLVSNGILIGSATEGAFNDMLIAAPLSSTISASSFSGSYTISAFFPGGSPETSLDATYQLNPNGSGTLGNVSISGFTGAGSTLSQNSSGVKYVYSNGAYDITFPTNNNADFYQGGTISNANNDNGPVLLYISPDSDFVFGGSALGFDIFVGVKNVASGTNTPQSGLYYEVGLDDSEVGGLDTYYGTFNAFQGTLIGHERTLYAGDITGIGVTYSTNYPTSISGTYTDESGTVNYTFAQDGIKVGFETGGYLGFEVALPYTSPAVTRNVYIDPTGVVNTASSAPFTAGVSPGDFVTIYNGTNLAGKLVSAPPGAFPTTLGGVTVIIDGLIKAPLYYVSPTQISFLIPYEASTYPIASIQVNNNGATSNVATTYVNLTTPGVFSYDTGIGDSALIDYPASGAPYYFVNENHPAQGGDVIVAYLSGLGTPFPSNGDGALGVFDSLVQNISVDVSGTPVGTLAYAGLAIGLAGLYQINFTLPPFCTATGQTGCVDAGYSSLGISGPDSYTDESLICITTASSCSPSAASVSADAKPAPGKKLLPRLRRSTSR